MYNVLKSLMETQENINLVSACVAEAAIHGRMLTLGAYSKALVTLQLRAEELKLELERIKLYASIGHK